MTNATTKQRVLMLLENNPYPQDGRVRREALALAEAGHQVSVIAPRSEGQPWQEEVNGVSVFRFPDLPDGNGIMGYLLEYGLALFWSSLLTLLVLFKKGFDVIHAHNPPDLFVLVALPYKLFGKKFVFDHHDLSPEMYYARFEGEGNKFLHWALVKLEQLSCKMSDHIIATNESYKRIQIERSGVPAERITVVRNGPDLNRLKRREPDEALQNMGKSLIVYVGDMGYQDGLDYLLRSLHHLAYDLKRDDFHAVLIGKGDAWQSMNELTKELELESFVNLTGYVSEEDLKRYLSSSDIGVDPDPQNGFAEHCTMIKMTEYMTYSLPIVAYDLTEHKVTAQDAGLYVEANNELAFAKGIAELMDDPERRKEMGAFGRQRIEEALAWQYSVPKLLEAYEKMRPVKKVLAENVSTSSQI